MGEANVRVRLSNAGDVELMRKGLLEAEKVRTCEVDALVDTGATRSIIPPDVAERLGLTILSQASGRLADDNLVTVGVCSPIGFEILGRETFLDAYWLIAPIERLYRILLTRTDPFSDSED